MQKQRLTPELKVINFEKSLNFYIKLVKFEILYARPEEEFAMIAKEGSQIMIEALTDKTRNWETGILEPPFGRGMHLQIQVSDVNTLYKNLKDNNYPIFFDMENKWYRKNQIEVGHRQFLVQDPDGYLLRFFEDLGER
ncbi:MAG: VOC family protein [Chlamydiota bacterium]